MESYGTIQLMFFDKNGKGKEKIEGEAETSYVTFMDCDEIDASTGKSAGAIYNFLGLGVLSNSEYAMSGNYVNWSNSELYMPEAELDFRNLKATVPVSMVVNNTMVGLTTLYANANLYNSRGASAGSFTGLLEIGASTFDGQTQYFCTDYIADDASTGSDISKYKPITGTIRLSNPRLADNKTWVNADVRWNKVGYFGGMSEYTWEYAETPMMQDFDVTHYANVNVTGFDLAAKKVKANYKVTGFNHYVAKDVVYMIPGKYTTAAAAKLQLTNGVIVGEYAPGEIDKTNALDMSATNVPESANGWYTLCVVTKYTAESGLANRIQSVQAITEEFVHESGNGFSHHSTGGTQKTQILRKVANALGETVVETVDITHKVDLANAHFNVSKIQENDPIHHIFVSGKIVVSDNNHQMVNHESHELYLALGKYTDANRLAECLKTNPGHIVRIDDPQYYSSFNPETAGQQAIEDNGWAKAVEMNSNGNYNLLIPDWLDDNSIKEYTLFVKTNYADKSMSPTYHAVTALTDPTFTGVDNIAVEIENGNATYYNLNGVQVDAENLVPGVYIKSVNGKSEKVTVK